MNPSISAGGIHSWSIFPISICPWTQSDKEEIRRGGTLITLKLVPLALTHHI